MTSSRPVHRGFAASAALHVGVVILLMGLARTTEQGRNAISKTPMFLPDISWLIVPGTAGGGGGGGNQHAQPPRRAAQPGTDVRTVPAARPQSASATPSDRESTQQLDIPAQPMAASIVAIAGSVDALSDLSSDSRGPGDGPGAGSGLGPGDGPNRGSGLGDGLDRNIGGGPYRPGSGVNPPTELRRGIPKYTADAMRARLQGVVLVECVVETTGRCSRTHVVRGLEPSFGLNEEAVRAAEEWRFRPGTRGGQPVPVLVTMEITFVLR